jgi:hypothetical protein
MQVTSICGAAHARTLHNRDKYAAFSVYIVGDLTLHEAITATSFTFPLKPN